LGSSGVDRREADRGTGEGLRRRLAELMVADSDVRLAIIDAVLADVATRSDLEKLRSEIERGQEAREQDLNT
jgi:hypothetical protein